jgi:hypothetical protein
VEIHGLGVALSEKPAQVLGNLVSLRAQMSAKKWGWSCSEIHFGNN